jgi:hypothetical protein
MKKKNGLIKNLIQEIEISPSAPDEETKASKSLYQDQYDEATLTNFLQNQAARKKYSHRIFIITSGWLGFVILILLFQGFKLFNFSLSNPVLMALLGTTTVNVLGFFVIVIQYLFNKQKST